MLTDGALDDLQWFSSILQHGTLRGIPTLLFGQLPAPDIHLYMDASDHGLCVLDPAHHRYVIVVFDEEERQRLRATNSTVAFDINVREQLCIAYACVLFGASWSGVAATPWSHIRCWTDNRTALARTNSLAPKSTFAQELNRCIGLTEATYRFRVSTEHLPGSTNTIADAGSRLDVAFNRRLFTDYVRDWMQVPVPQTLHKVYKTFSANFKPHHWPTAPESPMTGRGLNGASGGPSSLEFVEFAIACWTGATGSGTNSPATVLSKISHLAWHHLQRYGYGVRLQDAHLLAMREMRRLSPPSSRKSPVTPQILRQLRSALDSRRALHRVIWGTTVIGYYFLLRRSEYLAVDGKTSSFIIQRCDILFADDSNARAINRKAATKVTITFKGSKTDQFGESTTRTLSRSGSSWLCPVRTTWALVTEGSSASQPEVSLLCVLPDGATLAAIQMARWIKFAARQCGLDESIYSTHSLRSGGATALFAAGSQDTVIKIHGQWRSDCFQRYVHIDNASTKNIAKEMADGAHPTIAREDRRSTNRHALEGQPPLREGRR